MLRGCDLRQPVLESLCLHLQNSRQRPHLPFDRLEAHERIELTLKLFERTLRLEPHEPVVHPFKRIRTRGLSNSIAHDFQAANDVRQSTDDHVAIMSVVAQTEPTERCTTSVPWLQSPRRAPHALRCCVTRSRNPRTGLNGQVDMLSGVDWRAPETPGGGAARDRPSCS